MKQTVKKVLSLFCAAVMAMGFTGCEFDQKEKITAYQIAVQHGFVGTEEEWLQSLKGANGKDAEQIKINDLYEAAQNAGYKGNFLEFLKEYVQLDVTPNNDTTTIAENMFSVVSINSGFRKTEKVSGGWLGSTTTEESVYTLAGSGVIIDLNKEAGNATIITNYHVVYHYESNTSTQISDSIYVYPYGAYNGYNLATGKDEDGEGIKARYVGGAMDYDIAILQIEGSEYIRNNYVSVAKIGDSNQVKAGEKVYVIGNPKNEGIAVTGGLISVDSEYIAMESLDGKNREVRHRVIRTDAAINGGASGGALFNAYGQLIGIPSAKNTSQGIDNLGYALPISSAQHLWNNLLDNGGVLKLATMGIVTLLTDTDADLVNGEVVWKEKNVVTKVIADSLAYGKIKVGDVILSATFKGEKTDITRRYYLNDLLMDVRKGDFVTFTLLRDGSEMEITLTFDEDKYFTVMS